MLLRAPCWLSPVLLSVVVAWYAAAGGPRQHEYFTYRAAPSHSASSLMVDLVLVATSRM